MGVPLPPCPRKGMPSALSARRGGKMRDTRGQQRLGRPHVPRCRSWCGERPHGRILDSALQQASARRGRGGLPGEGGARMVTLQRTGSKRGPPQVASPPQGRGRASPYRPAPLPVRAGWQRLRAGLPVPGRIVLVSLLLGTAEAEPLPR